MSKHKIDCKYCGHRFDWTFEPDNDFQTMDDIIKYDYETLCPQCQCPVRVSECKVDDKLPDEIHISWHIEDVKSIAEDLTDDECREVLQAAKRGHDATIGINWDVLEFHADEVRNARVAVA